MGALRRLLLARRTGALMAGGLLAVVIAIAAGFAVTRGFAPSAPAPGAAASTAPPAALPADTSSAGSPTAAASPAALAEAADKTSILVLPFTAAGDDPALAQLGDAIAADVTLALAKNPEVSITMPETGAPSSGKSPRDIAQAMGTAYVLTGSLSKSQDEVQIAARLIDARSGLPDWAGVFAGPADNSAEARAPVVKRIVALTLDHLRKAPPP